MLVASFAAELSLLPCGKCAARCRREGCWGIACGRVAGGFNPLGANIVSIATLLHGAIPDDEILVEQGRKWMKKPMAAEGVVGQWLARLKDWREEKESKRLKKRVEEIKIAGRPPVAAQRSLEVRSTIAEPRRSRGSMTKRPRKIRAACRR